MGKRGVVVTQRQCTSEWADIVIIGNGIAGLTAALETRKLAPHASIAIITEQCHPTINTPALKQFAIGKMTQEQLLAFPPGTERAQRIHIITARAEYIHAQEKYIRLKGGYGFGYRSLLIATGSVPNGLPPQLPGRNFDGVLTLHNLHDYLSLRRRLPEVDAAVVVGGGTHAIETVMGLLHHGIEVHWLIRSEAFLPKMLDRVASDMVLDTVRHAGVKVYTNTEVLGIVGRVGSVAGVVTDKQKMIPCQLVLTCTGTAPVTTLAKACDEPMLHGRGIYVDAQFRTSVRDVYAVGDVAAVKNPLTGHYETQAQWYAATIHGSTVAAAMTGQYELAAKSAGVSWHATHLGELFMLSVGTPVNQLRGSTTLTDGGKKRYCRMSILNDRLVGYLSLGMTQPDSLAIKRIIDEGLSIQNVKKALLKGNFDARKYFSGWRAHTVQEMVTSGKIPAVIVNQIPAVHYVSPLPVMPPQPRVPAVVIGYGQRTTDALPAAAPHIMPSVKAAQVPNMVGPRQTEPLQERAVSVYNQSTIHQWEEPVEFVTGKQLVPEPKGISAKLLTLPSRSVSRNLWAYSAKIPVVKATSVEGDTTK